MKHFFCRPAWERHQLTERQIQMLAAHGEAILKWNRRINLTGARSGRDLLPHFYLSLCFREHLDLAHDRRVLDLGSGAGFPGIPLKVCHENLRMDLVDAREKRVSFLKAVTCRLGLAGLHSYACRWENLTSLLGPRVRYDCIVSRGADRLAAIVESTYDLLLDSGRWVVLKGKRKAGEIEDLEERYQGKIKVRSCACPVQGAWGRDYVFAVIRKCFT